MSKLKKKYLDLGTAASQVNDSAVPSIFTPNNYVPTQVGTEGADKISAHLKGINNALGELQDEISGSPLDKYETNDLEDAPVLYVGMVDIDGVWLLKRFNETTGAIDYANQSSNPLITTYANAWTNRLTLIYVKFQDLTGV